VIIGRRQQLSFFVSYPLVAFGAAAVRTMSIATTMKLVLFMSAVRTLATVMMHAYIARVAIGQFFEDVLTVLITHRSARMPKHHLLEFLCYVSHF
jgi:hypothetical protein